MDDDRCAKCGWYNGAHDRECSVGIVKAWRDWAKDNMRMTSLSAQRSESISAAGLDALVDVVAKADELYDRIWHADDCEAVHASFACDVHELLKEYRVARDALTKAQTPDWLERDDA